MPGSQQAKNADRDARRAAAAVRGEVYRAFGEDRRIKEVCASETGLSYITLAVPDAREVKSLRSVRDMSDMAVHAALKKMPREGRYEQRESPSVRMDGRKCFHCGVAHSTPAEARRCRRG